LACRLDWCETPLRFWQALPDRISARHEDLPSLIDGLIDRNAAPHLDAVQATGDPGLRFPLAGFRASSAIKSLQDLLVAKLASPGDRPKVVTHDVTRA